MSDNSQDEEKLDLPVKPIEQTKPHNCGPTALFTALKYQYGVPLTLRDIELLTGITEEGTDEHHLVRALNLLGFKHRMSSKGTLGQLKQCLRDGQVPLVHLVMTDGGGHYMVVSGIDDENVRLADPASGKIVTYGIPFFMGVWKEEAKENSTPWYLVVTGHQGDRIESLLRRLKRIQKKIKENRS